MFNNTQKIQIRQGLIVLILLAIPVTVQAASTKQAVKEGNRLYKQGDFVGSKQKYTEALKKDPESDIINFNMGTALYKNKKYQDAVDHFQKVFLSDNDGLKEKAYYNAGNALYKDGISHEQENALPQAISILEQSLKQYERALEIDAKDEDAKYNREFVTKELVRLKKKQMQQSQEQNQQQPSDQSKQQEQQNQSQSSQDQQSQQGQQGQEEQEEQQGQQDQQQAQSRRSDESEVGTPTETSEQEQSQQQSGQDGEKDMQERQASSAQVPSATELTKEEARMLLESYQQGEEPQGQLNVHQKKMDRRPVSKDW